MPRRPTCHFSLEFAAIILYAILIYPLRANCIANLILFRLIILITFREDYKLWTSLRNFFHKIFSE
jgi:hypothetical protein